MRAGSSRIWVALAGLLLICVGTSAGAQEWPAELSIGGFSITNIKSSGSDAASGTIRIPGIGEKPINLTRNGARDVSGSLSLNARLSGTEMQGDFRLDGSGLKGKGSIRCTPKTISDASIVVSSDGRATGSGNVGFGRMSVATRFDVSTSSFGLNGSAPVRSHVDTPLAEYEFTGTLELGGSDGRMTLVANGSVRRTGKVSGGESRENVSGVSVDSNDGQARVNVGGVTVTFSFF